MHHGRAAVDVLTLILNPPPAALHWWGFCLGTLGGLQWVQGMNAIDAFTTASESYGDWENIAVAVLFVLLMIWLFLGFPGIPRDWLHDDWRR